MTIAIVWHIFDLRTDWNTPLSLAAHENDFVIPLFVIDKQVDKMGSASKWWLEKSLQSLDEEYQKMGAHLIVKKGEIRKVLSTLMKQTGASKLYYNDDFAKRILNIDTIISNDNHLLDPREVEVAPGKPYSVFTPFYKACLKVYEPVAKPPKPRSITLPKGIKSDTFEVPYHPWMNKLEAHWNPGRKGAMSSLKNFTKGPISRYANDRDLPGIIGTSRLSPYLHFGEISPHEVHLAAKTSEPYTRQLFWREFATYFIYHYPSVATKNWSKKFDHFMWDNSRPHYKKWQKGLTGFPIVDAGMRELWRTGWMHNRVRMIVASFLIKDLFIDWRWGEKWFWDTLVDADKANNVLGWQWVAGSGPDAAPYFRIFNPILQGKKFDPDGTYVRTFIPELENLPSKWIHTPWEAPEEVLEEAGISLGDTYPFPLVDHAAQRKEALKRFQKIKSRYTPPL